jgi:rhomboid protease GluP
MSPTDEATDDALARAQERVAERIFDGLWRAWLTYGLVVFLVVMHVVVGLRPFFRGRWRWYHVAFWPRGQWLLAHYGSMRTKAVDRGEYYRLLSAGFLHVDGLHLLVNTLGLLLVGRVCESVFGPVRTLTIFLVSTLGGTSCSWLIGRTESSVGASAGIFGLMGAAVWFGWTRAAELPDDVARVLKRRLAVIVVINLLLGLPLGFIDNHAHVGGLLAGLAAAVPMGDQVGRSRPIGTGATVVLGLGCAGLLLWAAAGVASRL